MAPPVASSNDSPPWETLAGIGEWELIRRLSAFAPAGQFSDDAAVLRDGMGGGDGALVLNTDVLVDGLHFSDATTRPADVGWRAAAANLSDLAAMGCTEVLGLTVGLVAPATTPWSWVEGVYQGLSEALTTHGGVLLGGDCSGGRQRLLAITALGRLDPEAGPIQRRDGRPGDLLVSTGTHGLSALGLALLQGDAHRGGLESLEPALKHRAIAAHRRPKPRLDAVHALRSCRPAGRTWRVGGCDSSDGLAAAVTAIATASGCGAELDRERLPQDPGMAAVPQALTWCLGGGEDFELVLALEPRWAQALLAGLPGATVIGRLVAESPGVMRWSDEAPWSPGDPAIRGFQHFG